MSQRWPIYSPRQLVEAGRILGIEVLDHLIVSKQGFVSLKALGHM